MLSLYGTVSKDEQIAFLPLLHDVKTSVSRLSILTISCDTDNLPEAFYTKFQNRGYLSKQLLKQLGDAPVVEERWSLLAQQLGKFQNQDFDVDKKKKK